jgi:hypothetical protein
MKLWLSPNSPTPCYLAIHFSPKKAIHFFRSLHKSFSLSLTRTTIHVNLKLCTQTTHLYYYVKVFSLIFVIYHEYLKMIVSKISIIEIFMLRLESEINYAHCSTSVVDQQTFKSLVWCLRVTKWETSRKWNALACGTRPNYSFIISTRLQLSPQQTEPLETCSMPFV